jgi:hypothetical protein
MKTITLKPNRNGSFQPFYNPAVHEVAFPSFPASQLEVEKRKWEEDGFTVEIVREQPRLSLFSLNTQRKYDPLTATT